MTEVIDALKGGLDAVVVGASQAADLRQPVGFLRSGAGEIERSLGSHLSLDGSSGAFASIASTSLMDISNDEFEVWVDLAPRFWSGGTGGENWLGRWAETADQRSWRFFVGGGGGGGSLQSFWSSTGANSTNIASGPQLFSIANGEIRMQFRVQYDVSTVNLIENRVFRRFSNFDPWTCMTKHFQTGPQGVFNSSADFRIGDIGPGGENPFFGLFYSVRVWDGLRERGGVEILNIDFTDLSPGITSFKEAAQGLTVNLNGASEIKIGGMTKGNFRYRLTGANDHHFLRLVKDADFDFLRGRINVLKATARGVLTSSGLSQIDPTWDDDLQVAILKSESREEYGSAIRNADGDPGLLQLESQNFSEAYYDEIRSIVLGRVDAVKSRIIHV
jgi:hypothetical protein